MRWSQAQLLQVVAVQRQNGMLRSMLQVHAHPMQSAASRQVHSRPSISGRLGARR